MKSHKILVGAVIILAAVIAAVGVMFIILAQTIKMPKLSQENMQKNAEMAEKSRRTARETMLEEEYWEDEENGHEDAGYVKNLETFEISVKQTAVTAGAKEEDIKKKKNDEGEKENEPKSEAGEKESKDEDAEDEGNEDYLCAYSSERLITEEDIENLKSTSYENLPDGKGIIQMVINEMYAKYGYLFQTPEIQAYFNKKKWYQEMSFRNGDMNDIFNRMTDTEKANVEFLSAHNTEE